MQQHPPPPALRWVFAVWMLAALAPRARATPLDYIPVLDPLEDEIRLLEVAGPSAPLPRLGMRPLQVADLPPLDQPLPGGAEISRLRLRRALARDRSEAAPVGGATPRLLQRTSPDEQRFEFSAGFEGGARIEKDREPALASGTGVRLRFGAQSGRWLVHTDLLAGYVVGGTRIAERILPRSETILQAQETYLAYTGTGGRWAATLGRGRWNWGPGFEGSLLLSKTAPSMTGLGLRLRIDAIGADGMILNATLGASSGEQLAAHRLEWQPADGVRLGVSEAARYRSSSWQPLYLSGLLPYTLVQNLMRQDEPDSTSALRNNVLAGVDASWRIAPGTRVYAEVLVDDLRTDRSPVPSKYGYQLGWEGLGVWRGSRLSWGAEFTRLTRYVYTSYFGRGFALGDVPLGYPTGPDARRVRARVAVDPSPSWQFYGAVSRTDLGESGLDVPFVPGSPEIASERFAGVVERSREVEIGVRYWPAAGIDLGVAGGYGWVDDQAHQPGASRSAPRASVSLRWVR